MPLFIQDIMNSLNNKTKKEVANKELD